jgi:hypothetical protein
MRKAMLFLAVFGFAGMLWAQDPAIGTWKLNVAKSKLIPNKATEKEETTVIRAIGDQLEIATTGTRTDGSTYSQKYTFPQQGGITKQEGGNATAMTLVATRIDAYHWDWTFLNKDRQAMVMQSVYTEDGKTLTNTFKVTSAQGKPMDFVYFFDKQ